MRKENIALFLQGVPSPYAVLCNHGKMDNQQRCYLTQEEYDHQMSRPNSLWICPICHRVAFWDDANYEEWGQGQEG